MWKHFCLFGGFSRGWDTWRWQEWVICLPCTLASPAIFSFLKLFGFIWFLPGNIQYTWRRQHLSPQERVGERPQKPSKLPMEEELGAQVCCHEDGGSWATSSCCNSKERQLPRDCVPRLRDLAAWGGVGWVLSEHLALSGIFWKWDCFLHRSLGYETAGIWDQGSKYVAPRRPFWCAP